MPHIQKGFAVQVTITIHAGPRNGCVCTQSPDKLQATYGDLPGFSPDGCVGVGQAAKFEHLVRKMRERDSHKPNARILLQLLVEVGVVFIYLIGIMSFNSVQPQFRHVTGHFNPVRN